MFKVAAKNAAGTGDTIQTREPVHCRKAQGSFVVFVAIKSIRRTICP